MSAETTSSHSKFYVGLMVICLLCSAVYLGLDHYFSGLLTSWAYFVSLGVFALLSLIGFRMQQSVLGGRPAQLANRFMAVTMLKLFAAVVLFISMILLIDRGQAIPYTVVFIVLYVVFSVFLSFHSSRLNVSPKE